MDVFETANDFGKGVVKSWASVLDESTRKQAELISRCQAVDGHIALMPDAHFGYGPPVGTAMRTRDVVMPYAVGVDIGCGMIAVRTNIPRHALSGEEGRILGHIRDLIPSGVGKQHPQRIAAAESFVADHGFAPGLENERVLKVLQQRHHTDMVHAAADLRDRALSQFGTLGAGNHFAEVCEENLTGAVWFVVHSGSRGIGNMLATAHVKRAQSFCEANFIQLEHRDLAWFDSDVEEFDEYILDMLWAQEYAWAQREAMMDRLLDAVRLATDLVLIEEERINCHHNYAEQVEPGVWLTRKGAINAEAGRMGIIPGSMGAATYIVRGKGCAEAYNTSPHGAGRLLARGAARRTLSVEDFREQMRGKTWLDRDAEALLDEAPFAYKPIETVIADSADLVDPEVILKQFINYKGVK